MQMILRPTRSTNFIWLALALVAATLLVWRVAIADPPARTHATTTADTPAYQYVGLSTTIARIDPASGRVWVLLHPEISPSTSIIYMFEKPGIRWRELPVERNRPN